MILISSPYSHKDPVVKAQRVKKLAEFVNEQIALGNVAFSPVLYGLAVIEHMGGKDDWATWQAFCESAILSSQEVWVLKMEGWEESQGVAGEINFAQANGVPVKYIDIN